MITKKNIYHYILYVIFALIFFCCIGIYSIGLSGESAAGSVIPAMALRYGIVFVAAAIIILVCKFALPLLPEKVLEFKIPVIKKSFEIIGLLMICVFGAFARIMLVISRYSNEYESVFLDYAFSKTDKLPDSTYATYAYANICKFLCKIHPSAYPVFAFNLILHLAIICLTYFCVKKALRMRYAVLFSVILSLAPFFILSVFNISPDTLLTFFYVVFLFFLSIINDMNRKGNIDDMYQLMFIAGLGIYSGFVAMWDILGISVLILAISSLLLVYTKYGETIFQNRFLQAGVFLLSFLVALFMFLNFFYNNGSKNLENVFNYLYSFYPKGLSLTVISPMEGRIEGIIIFVFAAIAIMSFIRNDFDKGLPAVIIIDIISILTFVKFNTTEYSFLLNFLYVFIAVVGFFSCTSYLSTVEDENENEKLLLKLKSKKGFDYEDSFNKYPVIDKPSATSKTKTKENEKDKNIVKTDTKENKETKTNDSIKPVIAVNESKVEDKKETIKESDKDKNKTIEQITENKEADTESNVKETVYDRNGEVTENMKKDNETGISLVEADPNYKASNMIKNPLPGPKPHVSRELTYDYEVNADQMDFDIKDLKGKDYYDI